MGNGCVWGQSHSSPFQNPSESRTKEHLPKAGDQKSDWRGHLGSAVPSGDNGAAEWFPRALHFLVSWAFWTPSQVCSLHGDTHPVSLPNPISLPAPGRGKTSSYSRSPQSGFTYFSIWYHTHSALTHVPGLKQDCHFLIPNWTKSWHPWADSVFAIWAPSKERKLGPFSHFPF